MFRKRNRRMQCGFCTLLSNLLRSFMCIGSRRGSTESYYRELGDQDTLRRDDRSSHEGSVSELVSLQCRPVRPSCPRQFSPELDNMSLTGRITGRFLTVQRRRRCPQDYAAGDTAVFHDLLPYLSYTSQWRFNAFVLDNATGGRCLPVLCVQLFHSYGLMKHFNMDAERVWKLFSLIEEGYHSTNPYHNAVHAADVTQAMHCFLQETKIREHMEPIEVMSSLLAAIAHDLDHPGVSQPFLIATSNHLAHLYENTSVLENHHWRTAVSCVIQSGVLENVMSQELRDKLIKQVSSLILATDITRQQEYLSKFSRHVAKGTLDTKLPEHRNMVLQIALKCADISNPCRPWEVSKKWSLKVCEEFFRQGDYERELNMPITALCDRFTNSIPTIQTGFFKFVVGPLMLEWHKFLQSDLSKQMMQHLIYNQNKWEALMEEELAVAAKAKTQPTKPEDSQVVIEEEDDDADDTGSVSDSNEKLLPLRRRSLTTKKRLKKTMRRFSVPLNIFQDTCAKKEKTRETKIDEAEAAVESEELEAAESDEPLGESLPSDDEKIQNTEHLRPDCKITCLTNWDLALRLHAVKEHLKRKQSYPPLDIAPVKLAPYSRSLYTSVDRISVSEIKKLDEMIKKMNANNQDTSTSSPSTKEVVVTAEVKETSEDKDFLKMFWAASGYAGRRESAPIGSQLRDNLTSIPLTGLASDAPMQRRKSMPADAIQVLPEPAGKEMASALPDLLSRTLSGKEILSRRRGSAPVPVVASELGGLRRGNGSRRKQNAIATCKASITGPEVYRSRRRSSLPVEVFRRTEISEKPTVVDTPPTTE